MSATPPQTLINAAQCYLCLGMSQGEAMALAMWDTISQNAAPIPPVTGNTLTLTPPVGAPTVINNPTGTLDFSGGHWVSAVALDTPNLTGLAFDSINLSTLTLTNCPAFVTLSVSGSILTTLDLTETAAAWTTLNLVSNGSLVSIDGSQMTSIANLFIDDEAALTTIDFTGVTANSGAINLTQCPVLTAINFPNLTSSGNIDLSGDGLLSSINFSSLVNVSGDIDLSDDTSLTAAVFGVLTSLGGSFLAVNCTSLVTINLSAIGIAGIGVNLTITGCTSLTTVNCAALDTLSVLTVTGCSSLVTLSFPSLTSAGDSINCSNNAALTSLSFASLNSVGVDFIVASNASLTTLSIPSFGFYGSSMTITGDTSLTSLDLSALTNGGFAGFDVTTSTALSSIILNATWPFPDGTVTNCFGIALGQSTVNDFIDKAFTAGLTSSTIDLSGGTTSPPSAPEAALVVTMNGVGNTVTTN